MKALRCFSILYLIENVKSILPTAVITIKNSNTLESKEQMHLSESSFGKKPPMKHHENEKSMTYLPYITSNLFCDSENLPSNTINGVYIVPRGKCSFEQKASLVQKVGGKAMIVYGTLSSRYDKNDTSVVYPLDKYDYDCDYGRAYIPSESIVLPYDSQNDNVLKPYAQKFDKCTSKKTLLTGNRDANGNYESCCAWDLHIWLYSDPNITTSIEIPSLYMTMEQFDTLESYSDITLQLNQRYRADYNASAILIWVLGIFVACLASYLSAFEYYSFLKQQNSSQEQEHTNHSTHAMVPLQESTSSAPASPTEASNALEELESLELTLAHAFAFILFASCSLFILFFFEIYNVVKVMYAFGCSGALSQVIFVPLLKKINRSYDFGVYQICCTINALDIGPVSYLDVWSGLLGYTIGITWLIIGFIEKHPDSNNFYWICQDVMGTCICITFLSVIRVNSLKVATVLLFVAFFYDIFFVFVTPLLFKKSIMVTVATSGGPPTADPTWCEKYPNDKDCQGGDPLPMLLTIPRIGDYLGGSSLLGLGDIVLPGLLLSFCRRVDVAKYLVGVRYDDEGHSNSNSIYCQPSSCCSGYFVPVCIAYSIGLVMANMAVYIMQMGQPALLYLVPLTVGCVSFLSKVRGEFNDLWFGPKVLKAVDAMMYDRNGNSINRRAIETADVIDSSNSVVDSTNASSSVHSSFENNGATSGTFT